MNSADREEDALTNPTDTLIRKKHIQRLIEGLTSQLPGECEKLVPCQTWAIYWITNSLALLEQGQFLDTVNEDVIEFISECVHEDGGYGGGPGQIGHIATSFAAVNALITLSSEKALESIDCVGLVKFLHKMKQPDGSFTMHEDGEIDSRATYCALAILRCLNIQDSILLENVAEWILSCQTYEGGFGSVPGSEAHGGYTFCCVGSLCLLNQLPKADIPSLLRWLTNKQLTIEGGFNGRSNKLVDSCYSYWQGAVFPLLHSFLKDLKFSNGHLSELSSSSSPGSRTVDENKNSWGGQANNNSNDNNDPQKRTTRSSSREQQQRESNSEDHSKKLDAHLNEWLFDCAALQDYILNQCQTKRGLLRDKPDAEPDFYHTCYALSGLSISQHQPDDSLLDIGSRQINLLDSTHPLFNLTSGSLNYCFNYFFKNKKIQTFQEEEMKPES